MAAKVTRVLARTGLVRAMRGEAGPIHQPRTQLRSPPSTLLSLRFLASYRAAASCVRHCVIGLRAASPVTAFRS